MATAKPAVVSIKVMVQVGRAPEAAAPSESSSSDVPKPVTEDDANLEWDVIDDHNIQPGKPTDSAANPPCSAKRPWTLPQWRLPPALKSDKWMVLDGFLIRIHGKARLARFQPEHRSCPVPTSSLTGHRVTVAFVSGSTLVLEENYRDGSVTALGKVQGHDRWTGFSFFEMAAATQT